MNAAEKKTIVGRIHYAAPKETVEFDDPKRYLEELKEALDTYGVMGGFRYETLTDDPKTRKAADDLIYDAYDEENPRRLEDYAIPRSSATTEIGIRQYGVPVGLVNRHTEAGYILEDGAVLLDCERDAKGHFIGGAGMDGMYLKTNKRYQPVLNEDGSIRAFQEVVDPLTAAAKRLCQEAAAQPSEIEPEPEV